MSLPAVLISLDEPGDVTRGSARDLDHCFEETTGATLQNILKASSYWYHTLRKVPIVASKLNYCRDILQLTLA